MRRHVLPFALPLALVAAAVAVEATGQPVVAHAFLTERALLPSQLLEQAQVLLAPLASANTVAIVASVAFVAAVVAALVWLRRSPRMRVRDLAARNVELSASEFLRTREALRGTGSGDFAGVYVLTNKTRGLCYVGQSRRVLARVSQHLMGHGNGDVYADFKAGDRFYVRTIRLQGSGYRSLDALERHAIAAFDAVRHGYNRTWGNS